MPFVYPPEADIRKALETTDTVADAAEHLGFSVRSLHRYMAHYGIRARAISRPSKRCSECGEIRPLSEFYTLNTGRPRPSCRACYMKRIKAYQNADPIRRRAHKAVHLAVKDGRLSKPDACACGSTRRVNAHHEDYSRPLDVEWLCGKCHSARHLEKRQQAA